MCSAEGQKACFREATYLLFWYNLVIEKKLEIISVKNFTRIQPTIINNAPIIQCIFVTVKTNNINSIGINKYNVQRSTVSLLASREEVRRQLGMYVHLHISRSECRGVVMDRICPAMDVDKQLFCKEKACLDVFVL